MIESSFYGKLPDGREVKVFTLRGGELELKAIEYGAIIHTLLVPDRDGHRADVVLGAETLDGYLAGHPWMGAFTGRVAGRTTHGMFILDGKKYQLEINDPPNHLHGGSNALDKKLWSGRAEETADGEPRVIMSCHSPDGECGYPGNVDLEVSYTLTLDGALRIDYFATTDAPTPLSLTNHSYFNLAGEGNGTIEDHLLAIHADHYVPGDENNTLSAMVAPVVKGKNDLRMPVRLGDALRNFAGQHGDNFLLQHDSPKTPVPAARLEHPDSGRVMEVETTESSLQLYTGRFLDESGVTGKCGRLYLSFDGVCLECQGYPDGVNHPEIEDIVVRPGTPYRQTTIYRFLKK